MVIGQVRRRLVNVSFSMQCYKRHKLNCNILYRYWLRPCARIKTWVYYNRQQDDHIRCQSCILLPWELYIDWTWNSNMRGWRKMDKLNTKMSIWLVSWSSRNSRRYGSSVRSKGWWYCKILLFPRFCTLWWRGM